MPLCQEGAPELDVTYRNANPGDEPTQSGDVDQPGVGLARTNQGRGEAGCTDEGGDDECRHRDTASVGGAEDAGGLALPREGIEHPGGGVET